MQRSGAVALRPRWPGVQDRLPGKCVRLRNPPSAEKGRVEPLSSLPPLLLSLLEARRGSCRYAPPLASCLRLGPVRPTHKKLPREHRHGGNLRHLSVLTGLFAQRGNWIGGTYIIRVPRNTTQTYRPVSRLKSRAIGLKTVPLTISRGQRSGGGLSEPLTEETKGREEKHGECKIRRLDGGLRVVEYIFVANSVSYRHLRSAVFGAQGVQSLIKKSNQ